MEDLDNASLDDVHEWFNTYYGASNVVLVLAGDIDFAGFGGSLASLEIVDLMSDSGANSLSLTVADVLDMTDTGLLTVLGDDQDTVISDSGWTHSHTDDAGFRELLAEA